MSRFRPSTLIPATAFLLGGMLWWGEGALPGQSPPPSAPAPAGIDGAVQALEVFFELGLPDTREAKWVRVDAPNVNGLMDREFGREKMGNAWLLKENADGTVELLINQAQIWKVRKGGRMAQFFRKSGDLPMVSIESADLVADLKAITASMKRAVGAAKKGPDDDEEEEDESPDFEEMRTFGQFGPGPSPVARILLFAAHLRRQGQSDAVKELLPLLFKIGKSPERTLEQGLAALAELRLAELNKAWLAGGEVEAYAKGVEAVAAEFSRGWKARGAALMITERLRAHPAEITDPKAKAAAELLMGLTKEDLKALPLHRNWLLPGSDPGRMSRFAYRGDEEEDAPDEAAAPAPAPEKKEDSAVAVARAEALRAFFARPRQAVAALALLSEDSRYLRLGNGALNGGGYSSFSFSSGDNEEARVKARYGTLVRPMELGELVTKLLEPVLPERLQSSSSGSGAATREWITGLAEVSDEELAWDYLRNSRQSSSEDFRTAISYLIEKGSPATIAKLEAVFCDPMVWRSDLGGVLSHAQSYLKRYPGDQTALAAKVKEAVKTSVEQQRVERARYQTGNEEWDKMQKTQEAAQMRRIDQLFKTVSLADVVTQVLAAKGGEVEAFQEELTSAIGKASRAEAEALIFPAAVKATSAETKGMMLGSLSRAGAKKQEARAEDAATRAAMATLLADESTVESGAPFRSNDEVVADLAARAILFPQLTVSEQREWASLFEAAPQFAPSWLRAAARAVASGKPPSPRPDATRVNAAARETLLAELAAAPPDKIVGLLAAKSPDEQWAVLTHLSAPETKWAPALVAAHFTVAGVSGTEAGAVKAERWLGRRLDETLVREVSDVLQKEAAAGRVFSLEFSARGALGGVRLKVAKSPQKVAPSALSNVGITLPDGPAPVAAVSEFLQTSLDRSGERAMYCYPIWSEEVRTKGWAEKFRQGLGAAGEKSTEDGRPQNNPVALEKTWKGLLEPKAKVPTTFRYFWVSVLIDQSKDSTPAER